MKANSKGSIKKIIGPLFVVNLVFIVCALFFGYFRGFFSFEFLKLLFLAFAFFGIVEVVISITAFALTFFERGYYMPIFLGIFSSALLGLYSNLILTHLVEAYSKAKTPYITYSSSQFYPNIADLVIFGFTLAIFFLFLLFAFLKVFYEIFSSAFKSMEEKIKEYKRDVFEHSTSFEDIFDFLSTAGISFNFSQWFLSLDVSFSFFREEKITKAVKSGREGFVGEPAGQGRVFLNGTDLSPLRYLKTASGKVLFNCFGKEVTAEMSKGKVEVQLNGSPVGTIDFVESKIKPSTGETELKIIPTNVPLRFQNAYRPRYAKGLKLNFSFQERVDGYRFEKDEKTFAEIKYFPWDDLLSLKTRFLFNDSSNIDFLSQNEKALLLVAAMLGKSLFIAQAAASRPKQF